MRLADQNQIVRLLLLLGFGNLASNGAEEVNRYSTTILSALMSGMDDVNGSPDLVMAAMDGLARVLGLVDSANIMSILVNICMKLKLYFETVRRTARTGAQASSVPTCHSPHCAVARPRADAVATAERQDPRTRDQALWSAVPLWRRAVQEHALRPNSI